MIDTYIYFHVYNMKCCLYICHKIRNTFAIWHYVLDAYRTKIYAKGNSMFGNNAVPKLWNFWKCNTESKRACEKIYT